MIPKNPNVRIYDLSVCRAAEEDNIARQSEPLIAFRTKAAAWSAFEKKAKEHINHLRTCVTLTVRHQAAASGNGTVIAAKNAFTSHVEVHASWFDC